MPGCRLRVRIPDSHVPSCLARAPRHVPPAPAPQTCRLCRAAAHPARGAGQSGVRRPARGCGAAIGVPRACVSSSACAGRSDGLTAESAPASCGSGNRWGRGPRRPLRLSECAACICHGTCCKRVRCDKRMPYSRSAAETGCWQRMPRKLQPLCR